MYIWSIFQDFIDADGDNVIDSNGFVNIVNGKFYHNTATRDSGVILAIGSEISMWGETVLSYNVATNGSGGGIYLEQSNLVVHGSCNFEQNRALSGGGIHASSSPIVVQKQSVLRFIHNSAKHGGGLYLKVITISRPLRISVSENGSLKFVDNHAVDAGGAVYISGNGCSSSIDHKCFIQSEAVNNKLSGAINVSASKQIIFFNNTAIYPWTKYFWRTI